jgi:hypothetical protein
MKLTLDQFMSRFVIYYLSGKCYKIESPPGVGKSSTISEAPAIIGKALNKNIGIVTINGATLNPMDLMGFGVVKHDGPHGHSLMVFSRPNCWVTDDGKYLEDFDGGIIHVEESDKMEVDVKKILYEASLSGRLGPHRLPKNWRIWFSGNRSQDRSGSTKELDHGINRCCTLEAVGEFNSWRNWAERHGVRPTTILYAQNHQNVVWADSVPKVQGPWCTARSLCLMDEHLTCVEKVLGEIPEDDVTLIEMKGFIGMDAAMAYRATEQIAREAPTYEEIVANPTGARCPDRADIQLIVAYKLAFQIQKADCEAVIKYVNRMPKDFAATFAKAATSKNKGLMKEIAFSRWAMANSALVTMITGMAG